jgi:hypothetical protein
LRVQRFGWPAATRRSGVRDIGGARCVDHGRLRTAGHGVAHVQTQTPCSRGPWRFVSEGRHNLWHTHG